MSEITALDVIWHSKEAEELFVAQEKILHQIYSSYAVPNINATATQIAARLDPVERRRMAERMEAECKPWREAMAKLYQQYTSSVVSLEADTKEP